MATDRLFNQTQGDSLLAILAQIRDGYNSVDGAFSLKSENPLQNKKITGAVTDIIETLGGTAQKSYAIGQYFLANDGYYYVATAAITAGSSNISSSTGGNCSKTCITAAMNNLSSQISNLTSELGKIISIAQDVTGNTNFTIPSKYLTYNYSIEITCQAIIGTTLCRRYFSIPGHEMAADSNYVTQYVSGSYSTANYNSSAELIIDTNGNIRINSFFVNGTNQIASVRTWVAVRRVSFAN